jgi:seryl-tRNA synthetase
MDPLSALGLAANIVQFVDFGSKLLSGAYELRNSPNGQLEEHAELETITKSLLTTSDNFKASVSKRGAACLSSNEKGLQTLCEECKNLAEQLLSALSKLKGNKTKLKSIEQSLKIIWGRERIEVMQKRLDGFRQQLIVTILVALR